MAKYSLKIQFDSIDEQKRPGNCLLTLNENISREEVLEALTTCYDGMIGYIEGKRTALILEKGTNKILKTLNNFDEPINIEELSKLNPVRDCAEFLTYKFPGIEIKDISK